MKDRRRFDYRHAVIRFLQSFRYAGQGLRYAVATQQNLRIHLCAAGLVFVLAAIIRVTRIEWILLVLSVGLVIAAELTNTAIEALVDLISPQPHELAKVAKDVAAGMVLIVAVTAAVVGAIIFAPYLQQYF